MSNKKISATCPHCGKQVVLDYAAPAPKICAKNLTPVSHIEVYRISSETMKQFLVEKVRHFSPNAKLELVPRICEKKQKHGEPHRAYASLRIAFSEEVIQKNGDGGWFAKIGESDSNVRFIESMFPEIIQKYGYNRKQIEGWLKSYKNLEELENSFGMTEPYINDLKLYSTPQRVKTRDGKVWVMFAAAPENIIRDMLSDPDSNKPYGRIQIQDVYSLNNDVVEYVVYVHPAETELRENPHVRQILMGEEKAKKA
jgi:hypothetical protein